MKITTMPAIMGFIYVLGCLIIHYCLLVGGAHPHLSETIQGKILGTLDAGLILVLYYFFNTGEKQ